MDFRPDIGIERRTAGGCFCHDTYTKKEVFESEMTVSNCIVLLEKRN